MKSTIPELTEVKGIGKDTANRLAESGITSIIALHEAGAEVLKNNMRKQLATDDNVRNIMAQVAELVEQGKSESKKEFISPAKYTNIIAETVGYEGKTYVVRSVSRDAKSVLAKVLDAGEMKEVKSKVVLQALYANHIWFV